jgi:hypothetical protein
MHKLLVEIMKREGAIVGKNETAYVDSSYYFDYHIGQRLLEVCCLIFLFLFYFFVKFDFSIFSLIVFL